MMRGIVGYIAIGAATFAVLGLAMPVASTSGLYWAWTHNPGTALRGVDAMIKVTNPTVVSGSMCAAFDIMFFYNNDFFKIGWCKGTSRAGNTYGTVMVYWEQALSGSYSGGLMSSPGLSIGSTYEFRAQYVRGSLNEWRSYVGYTNIKSTTFGYNYAQPSVQAEAHNTLDSFQGHFSGLQYGQLGPRSILWYPWNGYGGTGANYPPFTQSIISNTEWSFNGG